MDTKTASDIPWLMVPLNLAADVILRHSKQYTIHIADPTMVMVQKLGYRSHRVFGIRAGRPTFLSAVDSRGVHQAFLEVTVKSESRYKIAFYFVSDSNPATGKIIHEASERKIADLKNLVRDVNEILQPQANVLFDIVTDHQPKVILQGNQGEKVDDKIFHLLPNYANPAADFHVFFVWAYKGSKNGDALAGTDDLGYCVFEDGIPYRQEAHVLAHEAVHFLLFSFGQPDNHHTKSLGDLMYPHIGAYGFEAGDRLGRTYADKINPWDTV